MTGVIQTIAQTMLTVVFALGGAAAAVGGAYIGVQMMVGNASGSSQTTSRAIMALLGIIGGLVVMLSGPFFASQIIEAMAGVSRAIVLPAP
jgi:hypothetical protein